MRVKFLDGMRGLAALYVVLHHAYLEVADKAQFASIVDALGPARLLFDSGKLSVDVFIVLSGYVLMLPVMRSGGTDQESGGLLPTTMPANPPYYAAAECVNDFGLFVISSG